MLADYIMGFFLTPKRFRKVHLLVWQATIAGSSGAVTLDTANSSPGVTIARDSAGQYSLTFTKGTWFHPVAACTVLAEQAGSEGFFEAFSATSGTATVEFSVGSGTAAEVADTTRICITAFLGKA